MPRLEYIVAIDWPLVPNHIDLIEHNIHVDAYTGNLKGTCDWPCTEISPLGMSIGAVENLLRLMQTNSQTVATIFTMLIMRHSVTT